MNGNKLSHETLKEIVSTHFTERGFSVDKECHIQFGTRDGIADVVVKTKQGHWIAIVECKLENTIQGKRQLQSYLSATDTRFGILAFSEKSHEWIYYENLRCNIFMERNQSYFERCKSEPPTADRKTQNNIRELQRKKKHITIALIFAMAIIVAIPISVYIFQLTQKETIYQVRRIVDGDTIEIEYKGKPTSVQLIGVNAPEPNVSNNLPPEPYSEKATQYLQTFLLSKSIHLRFDEDKWDKHKRLLGYVYRVSDGIFINLELIREGSARVDLRYPFKHEGLFMDYESRAKADRKGLWGSHIR